MGSTFFRRWIGGFLAVCLTLTGMPALCVSGAVLHFNGGCDRRDPL